MYNNKWLYTIGFLLMSPLVMLFWLFSVQEFFTASQTYTPVFSDKYGWRVATSYDTYFITAILTFWWIGGLGVVIGKWTGKPRRGA